MKKYTSESGIRNIKSNPTERALNPIPKKGLSNCLYTLLKSGKRTLMYNDPTR